jgi:hypothetical protein
MECEKAYQKPNSLGKLLIPIVHFSKSIRLIIWNEYLGLAEKAINYWNIVS